MSHADSLIHRCMPPHAHYACLHAEQEIHGMNAKRCHMCRHARHRYHQYDTHACLSVHVTQRISISAWQHGCLPCLAHATLSCMGLTLRLEPDNAVPSMASMTRSADHQSDCKSSFRASVWSCMQHGAAPTCSQVPSLKLCRRAIKSILLPHFKDRHHAENRHFKGAAATAIPAAATADASLLRGALNGCGARRRGD